MKHYETYFHEALSDDDYRAVGRILVTFAHLEHALVRAGIALSGALGGDAATTQQAVCKGVKKTFKGRITYFVETYRSKLGDDDWIKPFENNINLALMLRDHFVHGQWDKLPDGLLTVEFFSRQAISEGEPSEVMTMRSADLDRLSETNKDTVKMLNDRFPAVCEWPRMGPA